MIYCSEKIDDIFNELVTSSNGLSSKEAQKRLLENGKNELPTSSGDFSRLHTFGRQFKSLLLLILIVAGVVSGLLGEYIDMIVILITVVLNACVGYFQENKANQSMKHLRNMVSYNAVVLRDGVTSRIDSKDIVVGDVLLIEAGDRVQADGRIINCSELQMNEAALTGESQPVNKKVGELKEDTVLAEQKNMVFRGTTVIRGKASVLVVATGIRTHIGEIAKLVVHTQAEETPLQESLRELSKKIAILVLLLCVLIIGLGLFVGEGDDLVHLFQTAVAVAIAAIPEGLVISLTMILALGMMRILRRNALVRRLVAAETLGSVTVICTDKTGTITEGVMSVSSIGTISEDVAFSTLKQATYIERNERYRDAMFALRCSIFASDGGAMCEQETDSWEYFGDTTDVAVLKAGIGLDMVRHEMEQSTPRLADIPFTSERKYLATLYNTDRQSVLYVKGAADVLLEKCVSVYKNGEVVEMDESSRKHINSLLQDFIARGFRVLLVAYKDVHAKKQINDSDVSDLVFVSLIGITDPIRLDVMETIKKTNGAGIRTIMITGDHVETARRIGLEVGIIQSGGVVFDGAELETMDDESLDQVVRGASVFARVNPIHKIRIVTALQKQGEVVAMTGDGVNDAPALKGADIGIALGSGTDVAKENSEIVLLDDSFKTIVEAVKEGRGIYENIRKVILYLFSSCFAEIILVVGSLFFGLPLALLPAQILWINILQDSFPVMGLAFDKARGDVLHQKPRKRNAPLIDWTLGRFVVIRTLLCDIPLLLFFMFQIGQGADLSYARTMTFVGVACLGLFYIFSIRHPHTSIFRSSFFDNRHLLVAVVLGIVLIYMSTIVPFLQLALGTVSLTALDWLLLGAYGLYNIFIMELVKVWSNLRLRSIYT